MKRICPYMRVCACVLALQAQRAPALQASRNMLLPASPLHPLRASRLRRVSVATPGGGSGVAEWPPDYDNPQQHAPMHGLTSTPSTTARSLQPSQSAPQSDHTHTEDDDDDPYEGPHESARVPASLPAASPEPSPRQEVPTSALPVPEVGDEGATSSGSLSAAMAAMQQQALAGAGGSPLSGSPLSGAAASAAAAAAQQAFAEATAGQEARKSPPPLRSSGT